MPALILLFLLLGIVLFILARRGRERAGLPEGDVVYSDTWLRVERPLYSERLGLTGKPDYLVREKNDLIPVEVKATPAPPRGPYDSHVYQLAAYCLLVAEHYRRRPTHGLVKYADRTYSVEFTPDIERRALALLDAVRADAEADEVRRSHNSPARCGGCGYREMCDESLIATDTIA
ncbi:MAG: CRISPR-associated protein Cas4 [Chloroflexi bacterium]|nr:CRISPR-associated protein Cas4 [Chloroflexota bacterium]